MAVGSRNGGMVLGARHVIGIFILLVLLFGVVFTLGYRLGRDQPDSPPRVADNIGAGNSQAVRKTDPSATPGVPVPEPPSADWGSQGAGDRGKPSEGASPRPRPEAKPVSTPIRPAAKAASSPAHSGTVASKPSPGATAAPTPFIPRGATILQVAALARRSDAQALAQALQRKKFPAFVLNPSTDHYYRVQVGPYPDTQSANAERHKLENAGFKSIIKR